MTDLYDELKQLLNKNQFITQSYQHYGGYSGFQDYGPLGLTVKRKLIELWRTSFLWKDNISEIETPIITPHSLLLASGHVDRFTDYVVFDKDGNSFRADHLVEDYFSQHGIDNQADNQTDKQVDNMTQLELEECINRYKMIDSSEHISVTTKNLMYPLYDRVDRLPLASEAYLRPELAQGIFVNFSQYKQMCKESQVMPFGIAQVGKSYRNEITNKQFTRLREFTQAEIEYFTDPLNKSHPLISEVADVQIKLLPAAAQTSTNELIITTVDKALSSRIISNQIIGYFLGKIWKFAIDIGLDETKIRFRQHMPNEMAHYASECWDLETFVNNRWLECVGCADRGDYDLKAHSNSSNEFMLKRVLSQPLVVEELVVNIKKSVVGKLYKEGCREIEAFVASLTQESCSTISTMLEDPNIGDDITVLEVKSLVSDNTYVLTKSMITITKINKMITTEKYYPHVIEPSFGIDRLMISIFDHCIKIRESDERRVILSLPDVLVPYNVAVFQLHNKPDMMELAKQIKTMLLNNKISCYIDNSRTSIGKRYVRADEIGVKYAITVDPGSLKDSCVTVRNRDTMSQIRVAIDELLTVL
jgi:glycyl-tRNA synthetase